MLNIPEAVLWVRAAVYSTAIPFEDPPDPSLDPIAEFEILAVDFDRRGSVTFPLDQCQTLIDAANEGQYVWLPYNLIIWGDEEINPWKTKSILEIT